MNPRIIRRTAATTTTTPVAAAVATVTAAPVAAAPVAAAPVAAAPVAAAPVSALASILAAPVAVAEEQQQAKEYDAMPCPAHLADLAIWLLWSQIKVCEARLPKGSDKAYLVMQVGKGRKFTLSVEALKRWQSAFDTWKLTAG
jgi:hypothetical protein